MLRYATNLQIEGGFIQVMDAHQGKLELSDAVTVYVPFDESYSVAVGISGCTHDEFSCCTTEFVAGAQRKGLISGQLAVRIDGAEVDNVARLEVQDGVAIHRRDRGEDKGRQPPD